MGLFEPLSEGLLETGKQACCVVANKRNVEKERYL